MYASEKKNYSRISFFFLSFFFSVMFLFRVTHVEQGGGPHGVSMNRERDGVLNVTVVCISDDGFALPSTPW